jgi:hypothetical protein
MVATCKGLCDKEPIISARNKLYDNGYKRCSTCAKFMKTDELRCYCCTHKLLKYSLQSKARKKRDVTRY